MSEFICKTSEIDDPGSRGFDVRIGRKTTEIFIVHKDGNFHAYENSCPHTGANLEWEENKFLDMDNALIQCSTHDALFNIDNGECIAGPCNGASLTPIHINIEGDEIHLA